MALNDIADALRDYLLADAGIATLVGARVHGIKLPVGVLAGPSVVYNLISEDTDHSMGGPTGLVTSRYQLDAWATTFLQARDLSLLVKERIDGYRGLMGAVMVRGVFSANANPEYDSPTNTYRVSRDYFISYDER